MDIDDAKARLKKACDAWKDRTKAGSWKQLASVVGRSQETARLYAVGEQFPPLDILPTLCRELGVAPIYILFGIEEDVAGTIRVGVSAAEMELLKLFRSISPDQQQEVIRFLQFQSVSAPLPSNVKQIR